MTRPTLLCALLLATLPAAAPAADLARIRLTDTAQLDVILHGGFDIVQTHATDPGMELGPPAVDLILHGDDEATLLALGFRPQILQREYAAHLAAQLRPLQQALVIGPPGFGQGSMGGYYTFAEIIATLDYYVATYPNLVSQKVAIGTSIEGRTLWAVKVSDNPNVTENEPRVLFDALHHAREPMSAHTLLWLLDHLTTRYGSDDEITWLVDHREIWFVPVVNPDGYVYNQTTDPNGGGLWRKNRRNLAGSCDGVDLNRNWPTAWGFDNAGSSNNACDETFRGSGPASEPEIQAMNAFVAGKNFRTGWSVHTYGEWIVEPYGYKPGNPPNAPAYSEYGADMAAYNGYIAGPAYNILYPANGVAADHYHDVYGMINFSPELGTSFWPPISSAVAIATENLQPALLMVKYAGTWLTPQSTAFSQLTGDGDAFPEVGEIFNLVVTLRNKGQISTGGPVQLTLTSPTADLTVINGSATLATLASLSNGSNAATPLSVRIEPSAAPGTSDLTLTIAFGSDSQVLSVPITVGAPRSIVRDNAESDLGWTVGAPGDTAATGAWQRGNPSQKTNNADLAQPEDDATPVPGTLCFVTDAQGGSAGTGDVDSGFTTLLTPIFDLSGTSGARIRYSRFYYCSTGDDPFTVDISNNGGQSWIPVESVISGANAWVKVEHPVAEFVIPTDRMRLRFTAVDDPNNSVTEALIDDLEVIDYATTPRLTLFGTPKLNGQIEIQLAGDPGDVASLYLSLGTSNLHIPGVIGTFGLDPAGLFFLFNTAIAADGLTRVPVTLPNNPVLSGVSAHFQAIVNVPPPTLTNVAKLTISNS